MSKLTSFFYIFLFITSVSFNSASAITFETSTTKKTCAVYSGKEDVVWREWTIKPGDIIDLAAFPEEVLLAAYSELYMMLVQQNKILMMDCSE